MYDDGRMNSRSKNRNCGWTLQIKRIKSLMNDTGRFSEKAVLLLKRPTSWTMMRMHLCILILFLVITRVASTESSTMTVEDIEFNSIRYQSPPLVNKCCQFNEHYRRDDGEEGKCVPIDPDNADMNDIMMTSGGEEHALWHVPTTTTRSTFTIVPDSSTMSADSTTPTQVPVLTDSLNALNSSFNYDESVNTSTRKNPKNSSDGAEIPAAPVIFRLSVGYPKCSPDQMVERIIPHGKLARSEYTDEEENDVSNNGTSTPSPYTVLTNDGSLIWVDENGLMNTRQNQDFCIDQLNETNYIALICKPLCSDLTPCIRKCCPPDSVFDILSLRCVKAYNPWIPYLYTESYKPVKNAGGITSSGSDSNPNLSQLKNYHFTYGLPFCSFYYISLREDPQDKLYAQVNGSLINVSKGKPVVHHPESYCIDGTVNHEPGGETLIDGPDSEPLHYSGAELDQIAVICFPENHQSMTEKWKWKYPLFAAIEFTTAFFLFLTAMVYIILWEQQNIHGWLQFAYVVSCLQSFTCLAVLQLKSEEIFKKSPRVCEIMGSVIHFSFLSAFFWMTSMNFDLWWTFSGCSPLRPRSKIGEIRRFIFFALFSWGSAGTIAGTGLILDHLYKDEPESTVIRPRFGESFCYFNGHEEQLPYFYAPLGVLLFINLIFFFSTIYSLHKLQKDTKFATQQSSKTEKKKFLLFMKLFVVMGVLWIFEVISWAVQVYDPEVKFWHYIFLPTDVLNASQGILIFIIFTCKNNTCRQIEGQLKKFTLFLQENRDKGYGASRWSHAKGVFVIIFASITLPIIHLLRIVLNYFGRVCGRKQISDTSGRRTLSNTTTVTSSTFDKSRKVSDCSVTTTISSFAGGGAAAGRGEDGNFTNGSTSSNNSSITNIEMDLTSLNFKA